MSRKISHIFAYLFIFSFTLPEIGAYYCDNDSCSSEQFCCGENICCNYVNSTSWQLICLLISVVVLAVIFWGFFQLIVAIITICYYRNRPKDIERHSLNMNDCSRFNFPRLMKRFMKIFVGPNSEESTTANSSLLMSNQIEQDCAH